MLYRILAAGLLAVATTTLAAQSNVSFELSADPYSQAGGSSVSYVVTGDFNNDGKPDIVLCCATNALVFQAGNGDGTFQPPVTAVTGPLTNGGQSLIAADFNGDGKLDLAGLAGSGPLQLYVWYGNGDGTFRQGQVYSLTQAGYSVTYGNFFSDGHWDIAVGESNGNIDLFRNEGSSFVFDKSVNLGGPRFSLMQIDAGDLNGNGVSDIAAAMTNGCTASCGTWVLWNDGQGNFVPVELASYANPSVSVGRLNGDAQHDVIVSYTCNPQFTSGQPGRGPDYNACAGFDVYYGQGNNQLSKRTVVTDTNLYVPSYIRGFDVNGDGYGDIVAVATASCDCSSALYVWTGNADGSFQQTPQQFPIGSGGPMALADFNRDGMMDLVVEQASDADAEVAINSTIRPACGTYTISPSVTACQPVDETYSTSPVRVQANSFDSTPVTAMQEYIDYSLVYSQPVTSFNTTFPLGVGSHLLVTKAWDASGRSFVADRTVTVYDGTPGPVCPAPSGGAAICLPSGTSSSSPVHILANGVSPGSAPSAAQLYINGTLIINNQGYCSSSGGGCTGGTSYIDTLQNLAPGTYDLVFKLWDWDGTVQQAERTITVE